MNKRSYKNSLIEGTFAAAWERETCLRSIVDEADGIVMLNLLNFAKFVDNILIT